MASKREDERPVLSQPTNLSRRDFIRLTAGASLGMAALGMSGEKLAGHRLFASTGSAALPNVSMQLLWIDNVQFAGEFVAESRGYYRDAGVNVTLLPGGTTITPDPIVASGKALVGISSPSLTGSAVAAGAALKIVGAQYQKNPDVIMSLASRPIRNLKDIVGKRVGVQANIRSVWNAFLAVNHLQGKVVTVPVQDDPSLVVSGDIDGFLGFYTNEAVTLEVKGYDVVTMFLQDYGLPLLYETYCVRSSSLTNTAERKQIKAVLLGDIKGWRVQLADPTIGVNLALNKYGSNLGLNHKQQAAQAKAETSLYSSSATKSHGLFWMSQQAIAQSVTTMGKAGIKIRENLFTNELLVELYEEYPGLR
jgi:ABC-type nitrate/sulfonate/bicarbonate transport system substrate-binding protein